MQRLASPATMRQQLLARLRAAGIHLGLSAVVFAATLYLIVVHWYPGFHFRVDGGWQGVRIMAGVDLVLGPLLTLIIFNPLKARRLIVFDLTCIGLAQLAALIWGFCAVLGQRPVSLNFHEGVFYSLPERSLRTQPDAAAALPPRSAGRPGLVYVAPPTDEAGRRRANARDDRRFMAHEDAFFFRPFAPQWDAVRRRALDSTEVRDAAFARGLPAFLERHGGAAADYRFFRYQAGYGSCFLALTAAGEPVDALGCVTE